MTTVTHLAHLVRRFIGSLSRRAPEQGDAAWALAQLSAEEAELWLRMPPQDRRHSVEVARRFAVAANTTERALVAGALLHDVGKTKSALSTFGRVAATVIGPRTKRFRLYHEHERIGADILRAIGSHAATIGLVDGTSSHADTLRAADST